MKCMPTATMPHTLVAVWVRNGSAHVLVGARDWRERPEGEAHVNEDVEVPGLVRELVVGGGVLHQGNVLLHPDLDVGALLVHGVHVIGQLAQELLGRVDEEIAALEAQLGPALAVQLLALLPVVLGDDR